MCAKTRTASSTLPASVCHAAPVTGRRQETFQEQASNVRHGQTGTGHVLSVANGILAHHRAGAAAERQFEAGAQANVGATDAVVGGRSRGLRHEQFLRAPARGLRGRRAGRGRDRPSRAGRRQDGLSNSSASAWSAINAPTADRLGDRAHRRVATHAVPISGLAEHAAAADLDAGMAGPASAPRPCRCRARARIPGRKA